MANAIILSKLKFKTLAELNQIKTAIDTLKVYEMHTDSLLVTEKMVNQEITYRLDKAEKLNRCACHLPQEVLNEDGVS